MYTLFSAFTPRPSGLSNNNNFTLDIRGRGFHDQTGEVHASCLCQTQLDSRLMVYLSWMYFTSILIIVCVRFRSVMLSLTHETCVHRREKQPGGCFESRKQYFNYCQAPTQLASPRPLQVNWTDPEWKWFSQFNFQITGVAKKVIFLKYILSAKKTFWKWFTECPTKNYTLLFTLLGKTRYNFLWDTL